jgi:hypothetical protein
MKNVCESPFVKDDQLNLWADMTKLILIKMNRYIIM